MDFGDILDKWEKQNKGVADILSDGDSAGEQISVNPIDAWMRVNGIYDKDTDDSGKKQNAAERRKRMRRKKPDAQIDIHGLTRDTAWEALERFFNEAKEKQYDKVMIIHGKGNHSSGEAVLKRTVREFIEHCTFAGESGQGKPSAGGEGATWVLLKHQENPPPAVDNYGENVVF